MGTLAQAKTLGEIGSILVLLSIIPAVGSVVAIIGFILILIAVKYISDALHDASIFSNILIAIILAIVGVAVGGVVVLGTVFRFIGLRKLAVGASTTPPTHIAGLVAGIIVGLAVVWIMFIVAAYFQRKSYEVIATRLNVGTFRTAALLYLIGAALVIILVGFVLLFVAQILFVVAFFSIKEEAISTPTGSAAMPPPGPSKQTGTKFCVKCGASLPSDVTYCPSCGASQPPAM
jgi:uncharacterized membrane protein